MLSWYHWLKQIVKDRCLCYGLSLLVMILIHERILCGMQVLFPLRILVGLLTSYIVLWIFQVLLDWLHRLYAFHLLISDSWRDTCDGFHGGGKYIYINIALQDASLESRQHLVKSIGSRVLFHVESSNV